MFNWKLRIGTKLAIASGLGVLFMAGIVINQQWSGGSTQSAIEAALRQSEIEADGLNSLASFRGMAMGLRDLRLVRAPTDIQSAIEPIRALHKSVLASVDHALTMVVHAEHRERLQKIRGLADEMLGTANELAKSDRGQLGRPGGTRHCLGGLGQALHGRDRCAGAGKSLQSPRSGSRLA